ncbi:bacteriocin-like protein [Chryseobacterium lacus]
MKNLKILSREQMQSVFGSGKCTCGVGHTGLEPLVWEAPSAEACSQGCSAWRKANTPAGTGLQP